MFCVTAFIKGHFYLYPFIFSCYAREPLNISWRTNDGTRTTY
jgi:hypothetical protein